MAFAGSIENPPDRTKGLVGSSRLLRINLGVILGRNPRHRVLPGQPVAETMTELFHGWNQGLDRLPLLRRLLLQLLRCLIQVVLTLAKLTFLAPGLLPGFDL